MSTKKSHHLGILELFAWERVVITEITYILIRTLSYTLHHTYAAFSLMKHSCWDRVAASPKPAKGQIVDVQEWLHTLVTCFFLQNHASLYRVMGLNSKSNLLAMKHSLAAWPCQPENWESKDHKWFEGKNTWDSLIISHTLYNCCSSSSVLPFVLLVEPWSHNMERMHYSEYEKSMVAINYCSCKVVKDIETIETKASS